ncbi:tetratricopeptide repeat protein [Sorangium sp. So ce381]|uniref:tetratricopeptide repeat protein n=1 Tax=Sorangium sp. So ce381 TaxID=3133307 RepID=UPI003F5B5BD2
MADPKPGVPPEVALRRLAALARAAGAAPPADRALARGRARLIDEVERPVLPLAPRRRWLLPAALAPLLVILGLWALRPAARLSYQIDGVAPGERADGAALADTYVRGGTSGATARFSEGTTVRFAPGARGRITAVTARGAQIHIEGGAAHFRVAHLPEAEWVAAAGPFTVRVTGTEFDLSWERERLELTMQSGSVAVRGPLASGGVALQGGQRLVADVIRGELTIADLSAAGARAPEGGGLREADAPAEMGVLEDARAPAEMGVLEDAGAPAEMGMLEDAGAPAEMGMLEGAGAPAETGGAAAAGAPVSVGAPAMAGAPVAVGAPAMAAPVATDPMATLAPASAAVRAPAAPAPASGSCSEHVVRGDFAGAIAVAEARGVDATIAASPLPEIAALADAARYTGRNDLARRALLAERSRFPGSPEARSAAFLLGRIAEAGSPAAAIDWYDRYLAESPAGSLAAEALGRKMIVLRASQGDGAARPIAEQYLARYPRGAFAAVATEILRRP